MKLTPTKSNLTGFGRVDALAAVQAAAEWDAVNESIDINENNFDVSTQRIFDLTGRMVNPNNLSPGVYILQHTDGHQVKTQKIMIR